MFYHIHTKQKDSCYNYGFTSHVYERSEYYLKPSLLYLFGRRFTLHLLNVYHTMKYVAMSLRAGIMFKNIAVGKAHGIGGLTF